MAFLGPLQETLHEHNHNINQFKTTIQRTAVDSSNFKVFIRSDRTPVEEHHHCFNRPESEEVAALLSKSDSTYSKRDIILEWKNSCLQIINELNLTYDTFQYPLLFSIWGGRIQSRNSNHCSFYTSTSTTPQNGFSNELLQSEIIG